MLHDAPNRSGESESSLDQVNTVRPISALCPVDWPTDRLLTSAVVSVTATLSPSASHNQRQPAYSSLIHHRLQLQSSPKSRAAYYSPSHRSLSSSLLWISAAMRVNNKTVRSTPASASRKVVFGPTCTFYGGLLSFSWIYISLEVYSPPPPTPSLHTYSSTPPDGMNLRPQGLPPFDGYHVLPHSQSLQCTATHSCLYVEYSVSSEKITLTSGAGFMNQRSSGTPTYRLKLD